MSNKGASLKNQQGRPLKGRSRKKTPLHPPNSLFLFLGQDGLTPIQYRFYLLAPARYFFLNVSLGQPACLLAVIARRQVLIRTSLPVRAARRQVTHRVQGDCVLGDIFVL
jgi:hypothetical protein